MKITAPSTRHTGITTIAGVAGRKRASRAAATKKRIASEGGAQGDDVPEKKEKRRPITSPLDG